jgi:Nuclease A inhibitor-like protein
MILTDPPTPTDNPLAMLAAAVDGLLMPSETDAPFEPLVWGPDAPTPESLRAHSGRSADAPVLVGDLAELLAGLVRAEPWHTPGQRSRAARFADLQILLATHLTDLQVYRVGTVEIAIYLIGRDTSGSYLGLRTSVVRT